MLPGCSVGHILHSWFCMGRPKGYYVSYLLVDLHKCLLLLGAPIKTVLSGHLIKRDHKLTVTQNMHCEGTHNT